MKKAQGFTLMEMIVAIGLFSIVSVIVAQLFITFNRTQRKAGISAELQSDMRVMMSQISERIRSGIIDYPAYGGNIVYPVEALHIIDENGVAVTIEKSASANCPDAESSPCLTISEDGGTIYPMSSAEFVVDTVQFYVDPLTDPVPGAGPDIQPRVTYALGVKSTSNNEVDQQPLYVQATVSSRIYFR